jgi:sugar O-acyltransferase (sialic acid O-acetyltransferase NeuD family)
MKIVIVGAGDEGAIVADILRDAAGFVDDRPETRGTSVLGLPVLGPIAALRDIEHDAIVVAIGDNRARRDVTEGLLSRGEHLIPAVHPFSSIASSATIGDGSIISAGAIVLPRAFIGRGVIVNTKASVDHDSVVGDFAHLGPGATLGGDVRIGAETFIALGASVVSGRSVGARSVIGAGAVVVHDIPDDVTAFGVPARITTRS